MFNPVIRFLDYIFVLRPIILIPAWSFFLLGTDSVPSPVFTTTSRMTLLALTMILISGYLLNQIFDRESDEKNNKCPHLSHGIIHLRTLVILAVVFFVGASFASQTVSGTTRWLLIGAIALGLVYSLPPLRLCSRPFLDMLANAIGYGGGAFMLGCITAGGTFKGALGLTWPYVILVASTFLYTTILDLEGDRAARKISTTVLIGVRASYLLAGALHVTAIVWAAVTGNLQATIVAGAALPFAVFAMWRRTNNASKVAVQGISLVVTIAAVVVWPAYALLVVPLIVVSRFYYKRRFGITYPGPRRDTRETEPQENA